LERRYRPGSSLVRAGVYAPILGLSLAAVALVLGWFTDAHHAFALGTTCIH